jgi:hypothetical protein
MVQELQQCSFQLGETAIELYVFNVNFSLQKATAYSVVAVHLVYLSLSRFTNIAIIRQHTLS